MNACVPYHCILNLLSFPAAANLMSAGECRRACLLPIFRMGPPATPDGALTTQPFIISPPFPPLLFLVVLSSCILSRRSSLVLSLSILVTPWRLLTVPLPHPSFLPVHKPPWRSPSSALSRRTAQSEVASTSSIRTGRKLADTTRLHAEVARTLETGKESNRQPRS